MQLYACSNAIFCTKPIPVSETVANINICGPTLNLYHMGKFYGAQVKRYDEIRPNQVWCSEIISLVSKSAVSVGRIEGMIWTEVIPKKMRVARF